MEEISRILDMLDWNQSPETQKIGRALAGKYADLNPFLQPITSAHNKNVWDNCALVLSKKTDEELSPYLVPLMEWLQDLNWPGAFCILERLKKYADAASFHKAFSSCLKRAEATKDEEWKVALKMILGED